MYQQQQAQPQYETVTLPGDAFPGKQYTFTSSNGQQVSFAVPAGMGPGSSVNVDVGAVAAAPQHQQYAQYAAQQYGAQQQMQPAAAQYAQYTAAVAQQQQQQLAQQQQYAALLAQQQQAAQYAAYQQPAQQQQRGSESVTLPGGAFPGKEYSFAAPDGRTVTFQVPQGMGPGSVLTVSY